MSSPGDGTGATAVGYRVEKVQARRRLWSGISGRRGWVAAFVTEHDATFLAPSGSRRSPVRRWAGAAALGALLAAPLAAQPAPPAAPEPAAPAEERVESIPVFFPATSQAAQAAVARVEAPSELRRKDPGALTLSVLALVFGSGAYLRLRRRARDCPRCRQPLSKLEAPLEEAEPAAAIATTAWLAGAGRGTVGCVTCGEVTRRRLGAFLSRDARCPSCRHATKVARLAVLEKPGYLLWGLVRVDESCGACGFEVAHTCAAPPLEAPQSVRKLRQRMFFWPT